MGQSPLQTGDMALRVLVLCCRTQAARDVVDGVFILPFPFSHHHVIVYITVVVAIIAIIRHHNTV